MCASITNPIWEKMMSQKLTGFSFLRRIALLACAFTAAGLCASAYAQCNQPINYGLCGENFLTKLNNTFLMPLSVSENKGATVQLYADTIDPTNGNAQSNAAAALWTEGNMIRALYWGTLLNPAKFRPSLMNTISQADWMRGGCEGGSFGYYTTQGHACYFDDNALIGGVLMDVYLNVTQSSNPALKGNGPTVLTHAHYGLDYVSYWAAQDPHGGVPQKPVNLGQGHFYMNPVLRLSLADVDHGNQFSNSSEVAVGTNYYSEIHQPALQLIDPSSGLFRQGTQYINGSWTPTDVILPGDQASVASLALALQRAGQTGKLADAENLANLAVAEWINPNGSIHSNGAQGGYALVDLLCQLYQADGQQQWLTDAKGIIDFLITNGRDTAGWYPNGTDDAGNWDNVRTGTAPDNPTTLLTQSAAAAAILQFAYTRQQ